MARQYVNLAEIYGAVDRDNALAQQRQYQDYQMQRQMKEDQRNDALRGAYKIKPDGSLDEEGSINNLYTIDPMSAIKLKSELTNQKASANKAQKESFKLDLENKAATAKYLRDAGAGVRDQASYEAWKQEAAALGAEFVKALPNEYVPDVVKQQLYTADKFLEANTPKYERVDLGGKVQVIDVNPNTNPSIKGMNLAKTATPEALMTDKRTREEGALNRGVTIRGQNMTDARSREANASGGKPPAGYRWAADGNLEAIKGGPGDKTINPTETQGKAALFSSRALEADKILRSVEGKYSPLGLNAKTTVEGIPGLASASNAMLSPEAQKADQAQRDFINAVLRQESGAAIGASEFDNARKQYFPQPGDSKEVIKQKSVNRQTAIRGLNTMAGPLGKRGGATGDFEAPSGGVVDFGSLK